MHWTNVVLITIFYIIGIILSDFLKFNLFIVFISILISVVLYLKYRKIKIILIPLAFFLGIFIKDFRVQKNISEKILYEKENKLKITILNSPTLTSKNYKKVYAKVSKINNEKVNFKILLIYNPQKIYIKGGEELYIKGKIERPKGAENFGEIDYGFYYKRLNIIGTVFLNSSYAIVERIKYSKFSLKNLANVVKQDIRGYIKNYSKVQSNFLNAIILGDRAELPKKLKDIFIDTGTIHILAISGLHIGIIMFLIFSFFKIFGIPRRYNLIFTLLVIIFYNVMLGYYDSVFRATIMFASFIICYIFDRDRDYFNSLALAALVILILDPEALKRVSFQLSFLSTAGIILFASEIEKLFSNFKIYKIKFFNYLIKLITASIASQIFLFPVLIFHFNKFAFISIIANIFAIPLTTIILSLGLSGYIIYKIYAPLGLLIVNLNDFLISIMVNILKIFAYVKPIKISSLSASILIIYLILVFLIFYKKFVKIKILEKKYFKFAYIFIITLLTFSIPIYLKSVSVIKDFESKNFKNFNGDEFIVFNIKGNSVLIRTFNLKTILIDGGRIEDAEQHIIPFLKRCGIKKIDYIILTSALKDRAEGLIPIIKQFQVDEFFDAGVPSENFTYYKIIELITEKNIKYEQLYAGREMNLDNIKFTIFNPPKGLFEKVDSYKVKDIEYEKNNSIVMKVLFKKASIFILGDVKLRAIKYIERDYKEFLKSDIILIPKIQKEEFFYSRVLNYVKPKLFISGGRFSYFEKGSKEFVKYLASQYNSKVIFTEERGAVKIINDDSGYRYITSK